MLSNALAIRDSEETQVDDSVVTEGTLATVLLQLARSPVNGCGERFDAKGKNMMMTVQGYSKRETLQQCFHRAWV